MQCNSREETRDAFFASAIDVCRVQPEIIFPFMCLLATYRARYATSSVWADFDIPDREGRGSARIDRQMNTRDEEQAMPVTTAVAPGWDQDESPFHEGERDAQQR